VLEDNASKMLEAFEIRARNIYPSKFSYRR
jgi:hypothetical protein